MPPKVSDVPLNFDELEPGLEVIALNTSPDGPWRAVILETRQSFPDLPEFKMQWVNCAPGNWRLFDGTANFARYDSD